MVPELDRKPLPGELINPRTGAPLGRFWIDQPLDFCARSGRRSGHTRRRLTAFRTRRIAEMVIMGLSDADISRQCERRGLGAITRQGVRYIRCRDGVTSEPRPKNGRLWNWGDESAGGVGSLCEHEDCTALCIGCGAPVCDQVGCAVCATWIGSGDQRRAPPSRFRRRRVRGRWMTTPRHYPGSVKWPDDGAESTDGADQAGVHQVEAEQQQRESDAVARPLGRAEAAALFQRPARPAIDPLLRQAIFGM